MKNKLFVVSLMSSAVLLTACGGGDGKGGSAAKDNRSADSAAQAGTDPTAPFSCPSDYRKITLSNNSVIANVNLNIKSDDGIATLTVKTPADGKTGDLIICLGKPDPVPAGVTANYVYEVKSSGDLRAMASSTLTLNFASDVVPDPNPPVIEFADITNGRVTYKPLVQGASFAEAPNYSLAANAQDTGLYVVRLTK
ncbi:hypothetical protein BWP39_28340 [Paraburkholderia acidicola]|uniref:Lipoprotein n=1 Tax=Paraburkholderia acidicola TaxID=1912599 RepID=A0A2A4EPM5_9BURK|nr:hypothetical protein [Paraburkholderia acidicola]PCE23593.1 hypothetical protein BWP39_28340 [Paraburkholderia acidicola]